MAHRCKVGTEVFDIKGGKAFVGGSVVNIIKGRVMVGGEVKDILFSTPVTVNITGGANDRVIENSTAIVIDGTTYSQKGTWVLDSVGEISVGYTSSYGAVVFNGSQVSNPYVFTPDTETVNIRVETGPNIYITTE